jgi:hypothetical protein
MFKRLPIVLLILLCSACKKNQQTACGTQVCTDIFVTIGVHFTDNKGNPIAVSNFSAVDQRTHLNIGGTAAGLGTLALGFYVIADDGDLMKLPTAGDDILISGTDPATNQTKTAMLKIAGGCNCHVTKLSGPDIIQFD